MTHSIPGFLKFIHPKFKMSDHILTSRNNHLSDFAPILPLTDEFHLYEDTNVQITLYHLS